MVWPYYTHPWGTPLVASTQADQKQIILMTYTALNNLAPPYLQKLLEEYNTSRTQQLLKTRKFCTQTFGARVCSCSAPALWNTLPHLWEPTKQYSPSSVLWKPIYSDKLVFHPSNNLKHYFTGQHLLDIWKYIKCHILLCVVEPWLTNKPKNNMLDKALL